MPFAVTPANERTGSFSPDGRYIAYASDEGGTLEVYVRPVPGEENTDWSWKVTRNGGNAPAWSGDGERLYYLEGTRVMMATVDEGPPFSTAEPVFLVDGVSAEWDVAPNGDFLVTMEPDEPPHLVVIFDWFEELKERVPTER